MKTTVIGSEKQNGAVKNTSTDKSAIRPAVPLKENANQVDPDKDKPKAEIENVQSTAVKAEEQPKDTTKTVAVID